MRLPPSFVSNTVSAIKFDDLWSDEPRNEALTQQQTLPAADDFVAPATEPSSPHCNEEQGSVNTPTAVPTTAVHHGDLQCTPLYKSTGSESEVAHGKRTEYEACTSPACQDRGEVYQPPLQRAPFQEEILHRYLKRRRRKLLCRVAMLLYSALQQMRLQSSFVALAALLRTVNEHLHERFLIAILMIVQQAHRGSLRLCHRLIASSLDQDVAQLVSNHSSMAATRQPMVHVRCSTIHGLRPGLLSVRSVSGATSITKAYFQWFFSLVTHKYVNLRNRFVICIDGASADGSPRLINCPPRGSLSTRSPPYHEQYYMEFLKQYGVHLICAAVTRSQFDQIRFFSHGSRDICNSLMC